MSMLSVNSTERFLGTKVRSWTLIGKAVHVYDPIFLADDVDKKFMQLRITDKEFGKFGTIFHNIRMLYR